MSPNTRGALIMIGSMTAFTVNDAFMKSLSDDLPLAQAVFLRGCATTFLMFVLARAWGVARPSLSRRDRVILSCRNLTEIGAAYFFITALFNMPIANATAILQVLPLSVTLAGALFLRQAVGWRRLSAIGVGFLGVMLIVRPGLEGFTFYSVYALAAVACVTARDIFSRMIAADIPSIRIALSSAAWVTVAFGLASLTADWQPVPSGTALTLGAASLSIILAYVASVAAMRTGEIAVVAPFRYTSLVVAIFLGFFVFGHWPDPITLIGAGIVVGTGLFTFWRERQIAAAARRAA